MLCYVIYQVLSCVFIGYPIAYIGLPIYNDVRRETNCFKKNIPGEHHANIKEIHQILQTLQSSLFHRPALRNNNQCHRSGVSAAASHADQNPFCRSTGKIISALIPITIGLLVAYIIQTACRYYVTYAGHMMGARMERDMRKELFDQYEKLSFSYYDQNNSGQMMSKLVSDLFDISELAHHGPENLFISLIKIIGSFIFLFMINRMLAVPMLILVVLMLVFSYGQNKKMQETFMDNRRKIGDINSSLQDTLAGIRVVQSFANERIEQEKFNRSNENFLISKDANYRCMGSFMSGNAFSRG